MEAKSRAVRSGRRVLPAVALIVFAGSLLTSSWVRRGHGGPPPAWAQPPTGFLTVCNAADGMLSGTFTFSVAGRTLHVPVGACSLVQQLPAGLATITEAAPTGTILATVSTWPAERLVHSDLPGRSATVTIVAGDSSTRTIVIFTNRQAPAVAGTPAETIVVTGSPVPLPQGCTAVVVTTPAGGVPVARLAALVSPATALQSIFRFNSVTETFESGFFSDPTAPTDFATTAGAAEEFFICVRAVAVMTSS